MPGFLAAIAPSLIAAATNVAGNVIQKIGQKKENRRIYEQTLADQKSIQAEQREYDSPKSQMSRFIEAGLNPHLIYGGGSSNAGGSFPFEVARQQPTQEPNYGSAVPSFISAQMAQAQTGLAAAKTDESQAKTAILSIQEAIAKNNPMLNPAVAGWVSDSMLETARLKAMESRQWMSHAGGDTGIKGYQAKINAEVEALTQRLGLNSADLAIKNKILQSKEFENTLKEIQVEFMKDADITPGYIVEFLKMFLMKFF